MREILILISVWLTGTVLGYILLRLSFRKVCDYGWGQVIAMTIVSLIFSWIIVIVGLIINAMEGNFGTIKSKPPKWL